MSTQLLLPLALPGAAAQQLGAELAAFAEFGAPTERSTLKLAHAPEVPVFRNEFWTAQQRQAHSLHEVSYRACFKPQLPRFFINRLTKPGAVVYDPFAGRGTTLLEAALLGRVPWGCDINPLSSILVRPRLAPPDHDAIKERIKSLDLASGREALPQELLTFYHPDVLRALVRMRSYFAAREKLASLDEVDDWLRMVATNRLTGHSSGFFSVYSLPPNQAVSVQSQRRINEKRNQTPPERDVRAILQKKSRQLLGDLTKEECAALRKISGKSRLITGSCENTPDLPAASVDLVVTSPPFLNEVDYKTDNWLRCWFNHIDDAAIPLWMIRKPAAWQEKMTAVLTELHRLLKPGGHVAFEVGEIRKGALGLEELVIPAGTAAGLQPELLLINSQDFTKTSNCWGVTNKERGTNSNRVVLFRKA